MGTAVGKGHRMVPVPLVEYEKFLLPYLARNTSAYEVTLQDSRCTPPSDESLEATVKD
jgi:hypothetical protein